MYICLTENQKQYIEQRTGMKVIGADRAEIKDEHLILYKKDSIVYFCPIERIDNFHARKA